jgi:adenylate cyclase
MERRLAAILAANVVGYSRLMGADEVGTLAALKQHRAELIEPRISAYCGRLFKLTGDGLLVEFPSVVNAVSCAVEIQHGMRQRNENVPPERRIELRIGINLGDVLVEDGDLYGDGVNVAARLESIAAPGGIAVSGSVHDQVGARLDLTFEDKGEHALKNIARPVRVFSILPDAAPARADDATGATPAQETPKHSVAVLPFTNLSQDSEQESFADGLTEDLITDLSRRAGLFVIARHSAFAYKGRSVVPNTVQAGSHPFSTRASLWMCRVPIPQHPPTMVAPCSVHSQANLE